MRKIISFISAVFVLSACAYGFSLNVDPSSLWLSAAPGESASGSIIVENRGDEEITVRAYAEDWVYQADRSKAFKKPGSAKYSCSRWISIYPDSFKLGARESKSVNYTVTSPLDSSGGYYSVIFFETQKESFNLVRKPNVIIAGRIGTIVYLDTKGRSEKKAVLENFLVSNAAYGKPMYFKLFLKNEGNTFVAPTGNIIITDQDARLYARIDLKKNYLLQGEKVAIVEKWTNSLSAGTYDVIATIDYGAGAPISAQRRIVINKESGKR